MDYLLNADDDWQERLRQWLYPRLHPVLEPLGGYAVGNTTANQYICELSEDEDVIEEELVSMAFKRNPIACLKSLPDGRVSEGSWVLTSDDDPTGKVGSGLQLHLTLFDRKDGKRGRELYAHLEDDWRDAPIAHLREKNFQPKRGAEIGTELIDNHSYLQR